MRPLDWTAVRFALVGVANTLLGLLAIYIGKWLFGLDDPIANLIGYGAGICLSFALNRRWTFRFSGPAFPALARFVLVLAIAYLANLATVMGLIATGLDSYLAQALGILPYTLLGYLGSRMFAFAPRPGISRSLP